MKDFLPIQAHPFLDTITIGLQIALIIFIALLLRSMLHRLIVRIGKERQLPLELVVGGRRIVTFLLLGVALLLSLDRVGISGTVIWTGFTGFVAVGAIAFFAAWSVLSNIFCAVLIFTSRPFGLNDRIEILDDGEKRGLAGEVMDINLIYTTLKEKTEEGEEPSYLRVPNSLFFQRTTRLRTRAPALRSLLG